MNSLRMICIFSYTVLRDVCLKTDFECSIKCEEQRAKSPLTEEALELETSSRNCWLSKICYFIHLPRRETIWSCRCCNFIFKWKSLEGAAYSVGPSGRCVQRCMFNCCPRWPLKTQYSALSFCQLPAVYWATAKQQQEFCNLSFSSNYKLLQRNVHRERICFQSLALWNGYLDDFILQRNWKRYWQNSFFLHTISFVFFWSVQIFVYLWLLDTWFQLFTWSFSRPVFSPLALSSVKSISTTVTHLWRDFLKVWIKY